MTSVPPKVHPKLLHHYEKNQRDHEIMPACVATSFRLNNNVYKDEYSREDMMLSDTASSPESEKNESSVKKDISKRYAYDKYEPTSENSSREHASSPVTTICSVGSRNDNKKSIKHDSLKVLDCENTTKPISQPIKKRILFGSTSPPDALQRTPHYNHSKPYCDSKGSSQSGNLSPSAFKPIGNAKRNTESNLTHNSSDILRQMYATFGSSNFPLRKSIDNLSLNKHHSFNDTNQISNQNQDLKYKIGHKHKRKAYTSNLQETVKHKNVESISETGNVTSPPKRVRTLSNTSDNYQQNGKRGFKIYKNTKSQSGTDSHRNNSTENNSSNEQLQRGGRLSRGYTNSPPLKNGRKRIIESTTSKTKRIRHNSGEQGFNEENSPDSPNISPHPLSEMYKHGGLGFPYMNTMLFNPAALAAYGLPGASLPVGMPGLTPPNPLNSAQNSVLFGANPYLNNSVLLREMLNQGSMFANHGFPQYPMHSGLTLEQMQAFQYLNNPALLHTSAMLGHGMINPAAAALSAASLQSSFLQKNINSNLLSPPSKPNNFSSENRKNKLSRAVNFRDDSSESRDQQSNHSGSYESHSPVSNESYNNHDSAILTPLQNQRSFSILQKAHSELSEYKEPYHQQPNHKVQSKHHKRQSKSNSKAEKLRQDFKTKEKPKKKLAAPKPKLNEMTNYDEVERLEYNDEDRDINMLDTSANEPNCSAGNYKNLTRERRLVANARERTRVHTISSAFDELRGQIPSYSCNQKLSKLAILRIACSYIRTLSVMAGRDETITFPQGVDQCTKVLQSESRARSRRKSNKAQIEWEMVNYEHNNRPSDTTDDNNNIRKDSPKPESETQTNTQHSVEVISTSELSADKSASEDHEAVEKCDEIDVESVEDDDVTNKLITSHEEQTSPNDSVDQLSPANDVENTFHDKNLNNTQD